MHLRAALFLVPCLLLAQSPAAPSPQPPKEVDEALRARFKEFMDLQVAGSYRKALVYVAEDTQDFYFQSPRPKYLSYKIDSIEYANDFTRATIKGTAKRLVDLAVARQEFELPLTDTWKIEDGKWFWYSGAAEQGVIETPFGPIKKTADSGDGAAKGPTQKDLSPEAILAAAQKIQTVTSISKEKLSFDPAKPGSEEIVFHNGVPGVIRLVVSVVDPSGRITARPSDGDVPPNADFNVTVGFKPAERKQSQQATAPASAPAYVKLVVEPFGKTYLVPVVFTQAGSN